MPKKSARPAATKKKSIKTAPKKSVKVAKAVRTSKSNTSVWNKPYLHSEQEQFHKDHPNARNLITVFIALTVIFLALYIVPMMR